VITTIFLTSSLIIQNESAGEQASGKPAWEISSSKVCGDRLCSEITQKYSEFKIPYWIRNNALWWSDGKIGDNDFLQGIQYLIDKDIMKIPAQIKTKQTSLHLIPTWIKDTAGWWATGKASEKDFITGIKWLIENDLIRISTEQKSNQLLPLEIKVKGEKQVRRGTTHTIQVQVLRGDVPIDGARVFLDIEDYGEDLIREFDGYTNSQGYFIFSWEIPQKFDDIETLLAIIDVTDNISSKTELFKFQVYCLPNEKNCKVDGN